MHPTTQRIGCHCLFGLSCLRITVCSEKGFFHQPSSYFIMISQQVTLRCFHMPRDLEMPCFSQTHPQKRPICLAYQGSACHSRRHEFSIASGVCRSCPSLLVIGEPSALPVVPTISSNDLGSIWGSFMAISCALTSSLAP